MLPVWLRRVGPAERIRMLTIRGRVLQVAMRDGDPDRPPLLLCNGIGARLELFQPFVDALDPLPRPDHVNNSRGEHRGMI